MAKYIEPTLSLKSFTCPHCKSICSYTNKDVIFNEDRAENETYHNRVDILRCLSCGEKIIWVNNIYVYPTLTAPEVNKDMPEKVLKLYNEAGEIYTQSPRAACALLRLAIDELCHAIGKTSKSINENIGELVKDGLPVKIQKALDLVRVIGNKAVHPGQIDFDVDDIETVNMLFYLINVIADNTISQPKMINDYYNKLPESTQKSIDKRDRSETK